MAAGNGDAAHNLFRHRSTDTVAHGFRILTPALLAVVGGMTIDDIVLPDGSVHRDVVGGNAYYTALGARLWTDRISVISFVGDDFDPLLLQVLSDDGIDTSLVARLDGPSIRLWILYERGGRRQIHYQHRSSSLERLREAIAAAAPALSAAEPSGSSIHVAALPAALQSSILGIVTPLVKHVTLDTIEARGSVGGDLASYRSGRPFDGVTAFMPSVEEMNVVRGETPEADFSLALDWRDLRVVVVKDGARGCRVYDLRRRTTAQIPAWPSELVDPTGAGDAFCGGFLVGLSMNADPIEAAILGTVSASFAVEGVGGGHLRMVDRASLEERRIDLRKQVVHYKE